MLYLSQREVAGGYHLRLTSLGMSVFTVVGLLMAAAAFRKRRPSAVVWIGSAATYLFISAWFDTITANHRPVAVAFIYEFWVKVPLIAYSIWFALKATRDRGTRSVPRWFPILCAIALSFSSPCSSSLPVSVPVPPSSTTCVSSGRVSTSSSSSGWPSPDGASFDARATSR